MTDDIGREELVAKIAELRKARNAIILAHNYQIGEVQDIADFVGDSLELSQRAAAVAEDVIVFCGVHFMAETASILAPTKTVLIPDPQAGCPMADTITAEELVAWKNRWPGRPVVCYVNTSAAVKAECDICCTSSNAVRVVDSCAGNEVLFAPDRNLAAYVARFSKKKIIPWDGYCYVHNNLTARDIREKKALHSEAEVWAHPECRPDVIDLADKVLSTGKMVKEAKVTGRRAVIVATEPGIIFRLKKDRPDVDFFPAREMAFCVNMKKITLRKVYAALDGMVHRVTVPPEIADRARGAIEKMVKL